MTSGEKKMTDTDTVLRSLKPSALDELAGDAHARRRDTDIARAMSAAAEPPAVRPRGRRPALVAAGVAAAACAATGVIVATGADDAAPGDRAPGGTSTVQGPVDARALFLASAKTAERAPAQDGRYWYSRLRLRRLNDMKVGVSGKDAMKKLPFDFWVTKAQESWSARDRDDRSRVVRGIGVRTSFPTERDEAAWKRAGSEELVGPRVRERSVKTYDSPLFVQIGNARLTMAEVRKLPEDAEKLDAYLHRRYKADVRQTGENTTGDYGEYVFSQAANLLNGPIKPGTRAALYRVFADRAPVEFEGKATDPLGRPGVAVSMTGTDYFDGDYHVKVIINPDTAKMLFFQSGDFSTVYERSGWVDELGARP